MAAGGEVPYNAKVAYTVVKEELELLERVHQSLASSSGSEFAPRAEHALESELRRLREVLVSGDEAKDYAALSQQFWQQSALLDQLRAGRSGPGVDAGCPYFAHLRLREGDEVQDICFGKGTHIDGEVRIVDWRHAPISALFYRYEQGEDYEETFGGRRRAGHVLARRSLAIASGELERVSCPEGVFERGRELPGGWRERPLEQRRLAGGEGAALRAYAVGEASQRRLGSDLAGGRRRADKRLPDIAGLLDPTQFGLIARPAPGYLVIRGTAGSGKTTVALHRIAYLVYHDPSLDSDRTLFVVFSPAMQRYVSHVLPALGVGQVRVETFLQWAGEQLRRAFPRLSSELRLDTPALVSRLKLHPAVEVALAAQVARVPGPKSAEQALDDLSSVLSRADLLAQAFSTSDPGAFTPSQIAEVAGCCRERFEDLAAWLEGEFGASGALDAEDRALLLRAFQLRVGPLRGRARRPLRYRHVAIDEAQDFSPLEVRVLLDCIESPPSVTLAGDAQQQLSTGTLFPGWSRFLEQAGVPGAEASTLRISYRGSHEIIGFARALLGPLAEDADPPLATRSGPPVELFRFTDHGGCVAFLADVLEQLAAEEPLASVALLSPASEIGDLYFEGLQRAEVSRLRRILAGAFTFAPGVEIAEIEQAKGLEFDYAVLLDTSAASFPESARSRRLLHVGATRAVHQLWLTCVGPVSPIVAQALGRNPG